jgi:Lar family restriction alleviation protein
MNDKTTKIQFSIEFEAKACPFCGSWDIEMSERERASDGKTYYVVECQDCSAEGPMEFGATKAIDSWNERKSPGPVPEEEAE